MSSSPLTALNGQNLQPGISILVPIKVPHLDYLSGLSQSYSNLVLSPKLRGRIEIIIIDSSDNDVFSALDSWFREGPITHIRPSIEQNPGENGKLVNILAGLRQIRFDKVLILDDDYRPTEDTILHFLDRLSRFDCLKSMVYYIDPHFHDLINAVGILIINTLSPDRQFCGHIGFKVDAFLRAGFPDLAILYDELAIERRFRNAQLNIGFAEDIHLEMVTHGTNKFFEQRVRYAYENLAYPFRFTVFLSVLPILCVSFLSSPICGCALVALLMLFVTMVAAVGQLRYSYGRLPWNTWIYAPLWLFPYLITTWIALFVRFRGGILFGGSRILRAV